MFSYKHKAKLLDGQDFKVIVFDDEVIGKGAYGQCYLGYYPRQDRLVIIKKVRCRDPKKYGQFKTDYQKELKNLYDASRRYRSGEHSNIVNVQKFSIINDKDWSCEAYLIMEYCMEGDLWNLMNIRKRYKEDFTFGQFCTIFRDIINGYRQLNAAQILHQDLKPENIFINEGIFKIGDFGLSYKLNDKSYRRYGTQSYNAPEKYNQDLKPCPLQDIYALGVIFYKLIYGVHPYYEYDQFQKFFDEEKEKLGFKSEQMSFKQIVQFREQIITKQQKEKRQRQYKVLRSKLFPQFLKSRKLKKKVPEKLIIRNKKQEQSLKMIVQLVEKMLEFNPSSRPTFVQIMQTMEKIQLVYQPVKIHTKKAIPDRYRWTIEKQSPIQPKPLPYAATEIHDIRQNPAVERISSRAARINVMTNLLFDITITMQAEIKKYNIYNQCIHKMVTALKMFNYYLTYGEYCNILKQLEQLSSEDQEFLYRNRQDYLINNTKANKQFLESELEDFYQLRKLPPQSAFDVMKKFIKQHLKEAMTSQDILVDKDNCTCFMLILLVEEMVQIQNGIFFAIEEVIALKEKERQILKNRQKYNPQEVYKLLEKQQIMAPLVQLDDEDD